MTLRAGHAVEQGWHNDPGILRGGKPTAQPPAIPGVKVKTPGTESEIEFSKIAKAAYSVLWLRLSGQNGPEPESLANMDVAASRHSPNHWSC
ncbi:hypothetical protein PproGo58_30020 [Pseudomonas protegens]|nr:hypothetical protein PproGo58_30020 [Pseudomonas protegens]